jgi:hypothetical protein
MVCRVELGLQWKSWPHRHRVMATPLKVFNPLLDNPPFHLPVDPSSPPSLVWKNPNGSAPDLGQLNRTPDPVRFMAWKGTSIHRTSLYRVEGPPIPLPALPAGLVGHSQKAGQIKETRVEPCLSPRTPLRWLVWT